MLSWLIQLICQDEHEHCLTNTYCLFAKIITSHHVDSRKRFSNFDNLLLALSCPRANIFMCSCQAPFPLTIFRSNLKFYQNMQWSSLKCTLPITTTFCTRHDSVTVVTCEKLRCDRYTHFKLGHSKSWSNFEFDRNIVSRTGARCKYRGTQLVTDIWRLTSWIRKLTSCKLLRGPS